MVAALCRMCMYLTPVGEITSRFRSCSRAFVVEPPTDGGSYQARVTLQHSKAEYSAVREGCIAAGRRVGLNLLQRPGAGQHLHGVVDASVLEDDGEVLHEQVERAHPCRRGAW